MSDTYRDTFGVKSGVQFADTIYELIGAVNIATESVGFYSDAYYMPGGTRDFLAVQDRTFGAVGESFGDAEVCFAEDRFATGGSAFVPGIGVKDLVGARGSAAASDDLFGIVRDHIGISDTSFYGIFYYAVEFVATRSFASGEEDDSPSVPLVTEKFYVSSRYIDNLSARIIERIGARSAAFASYTLRDYLKEVVGVKDRTVARVIESVSEKVGATSSAFLIPSAAVARDLVGARSRVFGESYVSLTSVERLGVQSRATVGVGNVTRESFKVADSVYIRLDSRATIRDRFGISSTALPDLSNNVFYRDRFGISVSAFVESSALKVVSDLFAATSRAMPERNDPLSAWTTDLRSWGMSRYLNLPVREFVGVQYGFGPGGVYTGRGTVSTGRIETGYLLDRNAEAQAPVRQEKHLNYVYVYGASLGKLLLSVRAENAFGQQQVFSYESARFSSTPSAVRIQTGRGIRSTWLSFSITGAPFRIEYIEAQYTPTRRRI